MQIDNQITLGLNVALQLSSLTVIGYAIRVLRRLDRLVWEHTLMWEDYKKKHGIAGNGKAAAAGA